MAVFPSLEPLERSYDLGSHLISRVPWQNGDESATRNSEIATDPLMRLVFRRLTITEVQQIRDHYAGQRGSTRRFMLPPSCWKTHTSANDIGSPGLYDVAIPGQEWRYAGPPEESPSNGNLFDVSIPFIAEF